MNPLNTKDKNFKMRDVQIFRTNVSPLYKGGSSCHSQGDLKFNVDGPVKPKEPGLWSSVTFLDGVTVSIYRDYSSFSILTTM